MIRRKVTQGVATSEFKAMPTVELGVEPQGGGVAKKERASLGAHETWLKELAAHIVAVEQYRRTGQSVKLEGEVQDLEETFRKNPIARDRVQQELHHTDEYRYNPDKLLSFLQGEYIGLVTEAGETDEGVEIGGLEAALDEAKQERVERARIQREQAEETRAREIRKNIFASRGKERALVRDLIEKMSLEQGELTAQRERFCEVYVKEHKPRGFLGRLARRVFGGGGGGGMSAEMSVATLGYDKALKLKFRDMRDRLARKGLTHEETEDAVNKFAFKESRSLDQFSDKLPDAEYHAFIERGKEMIETAKNTVST